MVVLVALLMLTIAAPTAAADQDDYLYRLAPKYRFLTTEQLIDVGRRICYANHSGRASSETIVMVMKDLGVSGAVAQDIVITANIDLGC
ncbi:hypothetical protein A5662_05705 [Mycobacteriaceae bacterium 1482268.1]|nr:hypothetical protein A5662_05705 [Mycobacteriaceae bacterium 1482268.1]